MKRQRLFYKKRVSENILELFSLEKKIGLKKNYLKNRELRASMAMLRGYPGLAPDRVRKGQGSGATS
jgi:hypothetical protein